MTTADSPNRVVAAIRFLHGINEYYKFDKKERVVKVCVSHAPQGDEIAAHVGHLLDLHELQLESAGLTDQGLEHLKNLVKVRELWLESPLLTGIGFASLTGMTRLKKLLVHQAPLDGSGFAHLAKLRNLVELSINVGRFCDEDLSSLKSLARLEKFSFDHVPALQGTFAAQLTRLPKLRKLAVNPGVTDEGLAAIAGLSHLQELRVEGSFTDAGLLKLRTLTRLQTLEIHSPHVTYKGVAVAAELPELNSLCAHTPGVTDEVIPSLLRCSALEDLSFETPCLTEAGLQYLRDTMPRCLVSDLQRDHYGSKPRDEDQTNRPSFEETTPFDILVAEASDWDLVNGTFSKIGDRHHHWVDAEAYLPIERVVMLVWHAGGIIGNGGFEYLFAGEFPGDPDFYLTAEACKAAGLVRSYEAFREAFAMFPSGIVPHDPDERSRLYHEANASARDAINSKLWRDDYDNLREKKLAEFIRQHAAEFDYLNDAR